MKHDLKCINPYFIDIWNEFKHFELRKNDREYKKGDTVELFQYNPDTDTYTGLSILGIIIYILKDFNGLEDGYCILEITFFKRRNVNPLLNINDALKK